MTDTDAPGIAELVAKQTITEALHSYCRGLDRMDRALAEKTWHADGTADYGPGYNGTGAGFLDFVFDPARARARARRSCRRVAETEMTPRTGSSGEAETQVLQSVPLTGIGIRRWVCCCPH